MRRSSIAAWFPVAAAIACAAAVGCGRTPLEDGAGDGADGGSVSGAGGTAGRAASGGGGGATIAGRGGAGAAGRGGRGGAGATGGGGVAGDAGVRLELAPASVTATVGQQLSYRVTLWRGVMSTDVTAQATWNVSDAKVATISAGTLIARAAGTATIVAETMGLTAKGTLTVFPNNAFVKLRIDPNEARLNVNEQRAFRAFASTAGGAEMEVTAAAAWSADGSAVLVSNDPGTRGLVTGAEPGTANVTAVFGPLTGSSRATVVAPDESWMLSIEPPEGTARIGATVKFTLVGRRAADGMMRTFTSQATWKAEKPDVADFVAGAGIATCRRDGVTSFSASVPNVGAATGQVACSGAPAAVLKVTPGDITVGAGTKVQVFATIYYDDGSSASVTGRAAWRTSDANVATVMRSGQNATVTAVAPGTATITAAADGLEGTATVTIAPR